MWIVDSLDPNFRFERQGEIVKYGEAVLIRHSATSYYLASDLEKIQNDFGTEYELCVNNFSS